MVLWGRSVLGCQKAPRKFPPRFRQGSTKLLQVSRCLWFFGADPSWAAKRFRGRFHQGSAEGSAKVSPRFHQGFTKVSPRFHQASPSFVVPLGQICLGLPKGSFLGCQKVLWRVHLGFTEVPPRFHRGSTKVPPRFHQGCTKVSPRFHAVGWSLVEFHLKINRCCWRCFLGLSNFTRKGKTPLTNLISEIQTID